MRPRFLRRATEGKPTRASAADRGVRPTALRDLLRRFTGRPLGAREHKERGQHAEDYDGNGIVEWPVLVGEFPVEPRPCNKEHVFPHLEADTDQYRDGQYP